MEFLKWDFKIFYLIRIVTFTWTGADTKQHWVLENRHSYGIHLVCIDPKQYSFILFWTY